ncbi:MAG: iron-containing alcohol dehydrogenase [Sutterella sp.]|nr:iron-containing alcohol dehydrogenase [Sutterella sp.]
MQSYDLYLPTHLVFGKGRVSELGNLIKGYGKKVLLTYGGGSVKRIGLYDTVKKILTDAGCEIFELSGIAPNPKIESVRAGVEICKKEGIEFIVSIGGGSTLDCSKAISCGAFYDGDPWDLVIHNDRIGRHLPIFDVITLAATGSEYDGGGVITNEETKEKLSVGGCYPVASILNPEYTFTVPANQTAAGISDILSHTFEQYIVAEGSMISDGFCESMLKTVMHFGPIALKDPTNFEARGEVLAASSFGCCGLLGLGRTPSPWPCHGIEHEVSAWYDITHGVGLAIITPHWMAYSLKANPSVVAPRLAQYGVNVLGLNPADGVEANAKKAIEKTAEFFRSIGITQTLKDFGIDDTHFDEMADHVAKAWFGDFSTAIAPLDHAAVVEILKASL